MHDKDDIQNTWTAVDRYFNEEFISAEPSLAAALKANADNGLPSYDVSPNQGKLLQLFAKMIGARSILEVGTLGGYSTIWLGRALPLGGRLVTIEVDVKHAAVARDNLARAGLSSKTDLRIGNAQDVLADLVRKNVSPFDFVFIDADKKSNPEYFQYALKLTHPGSIIVIDNVVRSGAVTNSESDDPSVQGVRRLNELIKSEPAVEATVVQTVGVKGYDGFTLVRIK